VVVAKQQRRGTENGKLGASRRGKKGSAGKAGKAGTTAARVWQESKRGAAKRKPKRILIWG